MFIFDVHAWLSHYPITYTCCIAASTVAVSEVIWFAYKYIRTFIPRKEVFDVLMFNENGYECIFEHHKNVNKSAPLKCKNVNCSQNSINRIIETIDKAQYCIDMAMFTFNSTELFEALKQAMARGVQLRIICENSRAFKAGTSIWMLINLGAMMRGPKSLSLMHHKFCIIDEELRVEEICLERGRRTKPNLCNSCIINGSANWTIRGFGGNWENIVITTNNVMIKELQAEFNRMWKAFTISLEPVEDMKMFA